MRIVTVWTGLVVGLSLSCALGGCTEQQSPATETVDGAAPDVRDADSGPRPDGALEDADPIDSQPVSDGAVPDAAASDGAVTDAAASDTGMVDAGVVDPDAAPPDPAIDGTHFIQRGRCFEHTPRCADDADCDAALYRGCAGGRCQIDEPCGCASDADCAEGDLCFTNERVCGVCLPEPGRCPGGACPDGEVCVDGWCRDDCPGHDAGPPLDCRGEPDLGRCSGRWAYLREAGTCVPVDDVVCNRARNAFDDRADCVAHCRGPVACTVTLERVEANTEVHTVECPITHGPGACVALAHCLCELGDPGQPVEHSNENLRRCASWLTVPRGAITFADFCGVDSLAAVLDTIRFNEAGLGVFGPDTQIRLSPGCGEVLTDQSTGPMCEDGRQNAWETGVDCGARGCDACEE